MSNHDHEGYDCGDTCALARATNPTATPKYGTLYEQFLAEHDECAECGNAACRGTELFPMRVNDKVEARCWKCLRLKETTLVYSDDHHEVKIFFDGEPVTVSSGPTPPGEMLNTLFAEMKRRDAAKAPHLTAVQGEKYTHRIVSLEGILELEKFRDTCDAGHEFIVGLAIREAGAANVANVERDLFQLNSKDVRVTIEWRDKPDTEFRALAGQHSDDSPEGVLPALTDFFSPNARHCAVCTEKQGRPIWHLPPVCSTSPDSVSAVACVKCGHSHEHGFRRLCYHRASLADPPCNCKCEFPSPPVHPDDEAVVKQIVQVVRNWIRIDHHKAEEDVGVILAQALASEREACAKIAENIDPLPPWPSEDVSWRSRRREVMQAVAKAIRNRNGDTK